jgi:DNA-binding transcriptional LysR family regulator
VDLNLIRTFLEVCETRHFGRAAEHLHLTTSAVSARIKTLEDQLGTTLFLRLRNGIEPTATAQRLITQFRSLMNAWEQVRFLVSVESAARPNLTVAASSGVWVSLSADWINRLKASHGDVRLRLDTNSPADISRRLQQGAVDVGLTFEQLVGPEITSRQIADLRLRLMDPRPGRTVGESLASGYIHVDWSTSFNTRFASAFPDFVSGDVAVSSVSIVASLLPDFPGSAYLSEGIVNRLRPVLALHPVQGAPEIALPVFASTLESTPKSAFVQTVIGFVEGESAG